jgi:hypothetical protein
MGPRSLGRAKKAARGEGAGKEAHHCYSAPSHSGRQDSLLIRLNIRSAITGVEV